MAFDMSDLDFVPSELFIHSTPEVVVFQGLQVFAFAALVAVGPPVGQPFHHAFGKILAVGDDLDPAGTLEGLETFERTDDFHAVIGCMRLRARSFDAFSGRWMLHDKRPSARTGVSTACAVGE